MSGNFNKNSVGSLNNATVSGNYVSGWANSYMFDKNELVEFDDVVVEGYSFEEDSLNEPTEIKNEESNEEDNNDQLDNINEDNENIFKKAIEKSLGKNISKSVSKSIGKQINEKIFKNWGFKGSMANEIMATFILGYGFTILSGFITAQLNEEEYDIKKEASETGCKQVGRFVVETLCLLSTLGISKFGKKLPDGSKYEPENDIVSYFTNRKISILKDGLKEKDEYKALEESAKISTENGKVKNESIINKFTKKWNKNESDKWLEKQIVTKSLGLKEVGNYYSFTYKDFMSNYGFGILGGTALDTLIGIFGNVLIGFPTRKGELLKKNELLPKDKQLSTKEINAKALIESSQYGEELLKTSIKIVCGQVGEMLGFSVGHGSAGKFIGTFFGSALGDLSIEPFKDEIGEVQQGWCATASAGVIGGALAGPAVASTVTCVAAGSVVALAAASMLTGAAIGYLFVEEVKYKYDTIMNGNSPDATFDDYLKSLATQNNPLVANTLTYNEYLKSLYTNNVGW